MLPQAAIRLVIAFENGRLGNQLFQYAAIQTAAPKALLITIGMQSILNWLQLSESRRSLQLRRLLRQLLRRLGSTRLKALAGHGKLFSLIHEQISADKHCSITVQPGYLPWIAVFSGYFQDELIVSRVSNQLLSINPAILAAAEQWMAACTSLARHHLYFVHVRRSDYVRWPTREAPAVLSAAWYKGQMNRILAADSQAQFFVFTDDTPYAEELFGRMPNVFISKGSEARDLAAMSLCQGGGILSASSFAWWGAYYARTHSPDAIFTAPRYWAGWRQEQWYPTSIQTSWIHYVKGF